MMRLTSPLPDFANLNHLPDWLMGWLFSKGMDYIQKNYKIILKPKNFRKKFGWFQIISLGVLAVLMVILSNIFGKIHAKPIANLLDKGIFGIFKIGLGIFKRIEPEMAVQIAKKINEFVIQYKVDKITGINSLEKL